MQTERPKGHYQGPLSLEWCGYSSTVRAMPMNYLAADLSRIDAALWGREPEIGALLAEAPAMRDALRELMAQMGGGNDFAAWEAAKAKCAEVLARLDAAAL